MGARNRQHPEVATLGTCRHTAHGHGWWCCRCLRALAPGIVVAHEGRGNWVANLGGFVGFGSRRVHAMQVVAESIAMGAQ